MKAPEQYLPQLGGYCTFGLGADEKQYGFTPRLYEVDPESFKIIDGKLYLFYKTGFFDSKAFFENDKSPSELIKNAESYWSTFADDYSDLEGKKLPEGFSLKAPAETLDFAFLIGEWECEVWQLIAKNKYGHQTGGKWIARFSDEGTSIIDEWLGQGMIANGVNVRTFNPHDKHWYQTWATHNDKQIYLLKGKKEEDKLVLNSHYWQEEKTNHNYLNRVTFFNITTNRFDYKIDTSYDGGKTWTEKTLKMICRRVNS